MPSDVTYNSDFQIIEIMHTGMLTAENLEKTTSKAMALHKELGVNAVLIDTSHLKSVENLLDLYDLPKEYSEGGASRAVRIALVMPETSAARVDAQFYDDVCSNRGWVVQQFERRDVATDWLIANEFA